MLRRVLRPRVALPALAVAAVTLVGTAFLISDRGHITVHGLVSEAWIGKDALARLQVRVAARGVDPESLRAHIDGAPVPLNPAGDQFLLVPPALSDGEHHLLITGDGAKVRYRFTVDTAPPALALTIPTSGVKLNQPVSVTGTVEREARLTADGGTVAREGDSFSIRYPTPPTEAAVTATDRAGNVTRRALTVPVTYPAGVRAVHLSAYAWSHPPFRDGALRLLRERRINAVQLDIKEEDGIIGTDLDVPLARQIKAISKRYDVAEAIRTLHLAGARVIGRVVVYRDPVLGQWAWRNGHRDWVVQSPGGGPYQSGYGHTAFTNLASPQVRQYNLDVAEAAVRAGFDDVVFDYLRRPDGGISRMRFPGLPGRTEAAMEKAAERAVVDFCAQARARLHTVGGYVGAALFGQAVLRPQDTAQDVRAMAGHLDVIIPMNYPNHWSSGSYGVADPARDTYPIVHRSMLDWARAVRGTGATLVPWLWASSALGPFSTRMARDEIRGARDAGAPGWLMWNAGSHYLEWAGAFSPDAAPVR